MMKSGMISLLLLLLLSLEKLPENIFYCICEIIFLSTVVAFLILLLYILFRIICEKSSVNVHFLLQSIAELPCICFYFLLMVLIL